MGYDVLVHFFIRDFIYDQLVNNILLYRGTISFRLLFLLFEKKIQKKSIWVKMVKREAVITLYAPGSSITEPAKKFSNVTVKVKDLKSASEIKDCYMKFKTMASKNLVFISSQQIFKL